MLLKRPGWEKFLPSYVPGEQPEMPMQWQQQSERDWLRTSSDRSVWPVLLMA